MVRYDNYLKVICGPMFSGKTETLIKEIKRAHYEKRGYLVFSHVNDALYSKTEIKTHYGLGFPAHKISKFSEISQFINDDTEIIFIDAFHFFNDERTIDEIEALLLNGYNVVIATIDVNFKDKPFINVGELLAKADKVEKLSAVCVVCGAPASKTQRLIDGEPASEDDPVILIEGVDVYEPRCRKHHVIKE